MIIIYIYIHWLVVWNIVFPYIGNNHPNWLIFFKMVKATNQYIYLYIYKVCIICRICIYIYLDFPEMLDPQVTIGFNTKSWSHGFQPYLEVLQMRYPQNEWFIINCLLSWKSAFKLTIWGFPQYRKPPCKWYIYITFISSHGHNW